MAQETTTHKHEAHKTAHKPAEHKETAHKPAKKGSKMKIIIIIVVALAIVLGGIYYYIIGTPTYSLYRLGKAVKTRNSAEFNKYVDVSSVAGKLVLDVYVQVDQNASDPNSDLFTKLKDYVAKGTISLFKDQLKNGIGVVIESVSKNNIKSLTSISLKEIKKSGGSATATLQNANGNTLRIEMVQTPQRYWRVVSVNYSDLKELIPSILNGSSTPQN